MNIVRRSPRMFFILLSLGLAVAIMALLIFFTHWNLFIDWIVAASVVTFFMYGFDKAQAKNGGWRVPEIVLHLLALAGGFLGGWAGMFVFRHKTRHPAFLVVLIISTIVYLFLFYWFLGR